MEFLQSADFWIGLVKIIWINIILSGDNAVVIALAARSLPPEQQKKAILFGSGAAVVLRIVLTVVAAKLLALPYLQIVGGLLLLWIGVQLLGDEEEDEGEGKEYGSMMTAVRTILIADLVMSLDNVIAVAAAAQGSMVLLVLGLAISIPLVIFGSTLMIKLMERFPIIVMLGAALIGWVGGETIASDVSLRGVMAAHGVERGQFVTTAHFTPDAQAFAAGNGIRLLDGAGLLALIAQRSTEQQQALLDVALEGEYWRPTCASCGVKMVERTVRSSGKAFWGCVNYPRCRTTLEKRAAAADGAALASGAPA